MSAAELRERQAELARQVAALEMAARRIAAGVLSGLHRSVHRGGSAEFAEYKEYAAGDDPRALDWRAVARTDRWFVKRFEETTNRRSFLLLDATASMAFSRGGRPSKLELARTVLAALGGLLLGQGDAVGAFVLRGREAAHRLPARARGGHHEALLQLLAAAEPRGEGDLPAALDAVGAELPARSLVVLASDLVDDPDRGGAALRRLSARGHEVLVLQALDADEIAFPFVATLRFRDPETGEETTSEASSTAAGYRSELAAFLAAWERECAQAGAERLLLVNDADPARPLLTLLARRKALARRLLAAG